MKLVTLNIWGGKIFEPLINFIKLRADSTDIFCFQEMFHTSTDRTVSSEMRVNIYSEIINILPDFEAFFCPAQDGVDFGGPVDFELSYGLSMFVKKSIKVDEHGDTFVFRKKNSRIDDSTSVGRNVEYLSFKRNNEKFVVFNFHGLWNGGGKTDSQDRLEQSQNVKTFMDKFTNTKKILCGDFNLSPNTNSLEILVKDMRNLVKDFKITSTRSSLYPKPEKFADYILVSPDIHVHHFEVLQDEVSDHLPLLLEFD